MSNVEYNEDKTKFKNPLTGRMTKIEGPTHKAICRKIKSGELKDKAIIDQIPDCPKLFVRGRKPGTRFNEPQFQGGYTNIYGETDIQEFQPEVEVKEREVKEQEPEPEIQIKIKKEKKQKKQKKTKKEIKIKIEEKVEKKRGRGRPKKKLADDPKQTKLQFQPVPRPPTPPPQGAYIAGDAGNFGVMGDPLNQDPSFSDFRFELGKKVGEKAMKKMRAGRIKRELKSGIMLMQPVMGALPTREFVQPVLETKEAPVRPPLASIPASKISFGKLQRMQMPRVPLLHEMENLRDEDFDEILNIDTDKTPRPPPLPRATNIEPDVERDFWDHVEGMEDIRPRGRIVRSVKKKLKQAMSAVI